jgi:hypothetical protein
MIVTPVAVLVTKIIPLYPHETLAVDILTTCFRGNKAVQGEVGYGDVTPVFHKGL